jgi:hypothetical protein
MMLSGDPEAGCAFEVTRIPVLGGSVPLGEADAIPQSKAASKLKRIRASKCPPKIRRLAIQDHHSAWGRLLFQDCSRATEPGQIK